MKDLTQHIGWICPACESIQPPRSLTCYACTKEPEFKDVDDHFAQFLHVMRELDEVRCIFITEGFCFDENAPLQQFYEKIKSKIRILIGEYK